MSYNFSYSGTPSLTYSSLGYNNSVSSTVTGTFDDVNNTTQITNVLLPYDTIGLRNTALSSYTNTANMNTALSGKENNLTFNAPLTRSTNTISLLNNFSLVL
jgi:hypothetical protein